jgi:hypothetical protein
VKVQARIVDRIIDIGSTKEDDEEDRKVKEISYAAAGMKA